MFLYRLFFKKSYHDERLYLNKSFTKMRFTNHSKVGTQSLVVKAQSELAKVQGNKGIQHYPIQEAIDTLKKSSEDMSKLLEDVDTWKPVLELTTQRLRLNECEVALQQNILDVQEYRTIMSKVKVVSMAVKAAASRKTRLQRDAYGGLFREGNDVLPNCLSKICGDRLFGRIEKPGSFGIMANHAGALLTKGVAGDAQWITYPRLLLDPDDMVEKADVTH